MKYNTLIQAALAVLLLAFGSCQGEKTAAWEPIDRHALLERNNPVVTRFDSLASLTVGNGDFAYTVDATGLQTFPEAYSPGVPLGTQSSWGWHSFDNPQHFTFEETLREYDFGHGHKELYASQYSEPARQAAAVDYFRVNPHRLHLGTIGLYLPEVESGLKESGNLATLAGTFTDVEQTLELETGIIRSSYKLNGEPMSVETACAPTDGKIAVHIAAQTPKPIVVRMPYPTGKHSDDACLWLDDKTKHYTHVEQQGRSVTLTHWFPKVLVAEELNGAVEHDYTYTVRLEWPEGVDVQVERLGDNKIVLTPSAADVTFTALFLPQGGEATDKAEADVFEASRAWWHDYWWKGGIVDFSHCTAEGAPELERRVVLSQYLMAVNCAGQTPPQETGLTYNSWFGKYHMEMIWWHQAQFALWGHGDLLNRTLGWYGEVEPVARYIAQRQGFKGVRWMKMTDPSGTEAPSKVGSFLIWQQPHLIYLAELVYREAEARERAGVPSELTTAAVLDAYYDLVQKTAEFMFDFADYDDLHGRYILKGAIPAQETLRAAETMNSPFELSQWRFAMDVAQRWRERRGEGRNMEWEELIDKLAPLTYIDADTEGLIPEEQAYIAKYGKLYLAAETATETYRDVRFTQDHMAVLGALGIFPKSPLVREDVMGNTLRWVWDNWNWGKTWGWDYPMTSMCATRLGERQIATDALVVPKRTNTYLVSGHNYQDARLRLYLPGNGGLLTAVALMCAGWDGCTERNPGFPQDGTWDVRWEGLLPMP